MPSAEAHPIEGISSAPRREEASWYDVGLHRLPIGFLGFDILCLAAAAMASQLYGPTIAWLTDLPGMMMIGVFMVLWVAHVISPGARREWAIPDVLMALTCLVLATHWLSPSQYLAAGLQRPLIDGWLASADALLGVHTPSLAAWTRALPLVQTVLLGAYASLLPQFIGVAPYVGLYLRKRDALWEYVWHFHVCASLTLLAWALFPAASAFQYYGFEPAFDESRFIAHFAQLRAGTMASIELSNTEGMISMPSFHVAGALFATWAVRSSWRTLAVLVPINVLLVLSTVLSGVHYAVDVLGAIVLFGVSLVSWRLVGRRLMPQGCSTATRDR